ncbi:reticulon-like protein B11 [Curcuma longa]|uniref:reticulon-like protein B11 n=1 Tax=Curcuma longa TaxID=136217 RepID=UPI003D9F95CF
MAMAALPDIDGASAHDPLLSDASPSLPARIPRSVHRVLGGGAVADVLLWRRRNAAVLALAGATTVWFLFELAGYNFLSVVANSTLLVVVILFFWAKSALLLNRPLPPLPNLEVSDEVVNKVAERARVWINRVLAIGHDIAIRRDRKVFLQVILSLWVVSYIGNWFNFLTLAYIGVLLAITIPAIYDKYQEHIDQQLGVAHNVVLKQYESILSRGQGGSTKEKKTQ